MQYLTSIQIRQLWLDFFKNKDHLVLPSASLVPQDDPSLLLINSGVATLKDYFANKKTPPYVNLVNSQKCIRTNDIENVGLTARHLTFFEMLGNFSIGGYFKDKAIALAYEFIFKILQLDPQKIYITYHENDEVTYNYWLKVGIDAKHLIKGNDKTNFWDVGRGPCGYCTEIFYDRGRKYDPKNQGIKLLEQDRDNDRYLEIWNVVFSEFNNDGQDNYSELKLKNIDTGAGLERIVSLFQNGPTNFDTDLFLPIIGEIEKLTNQQFQYQIANYFTKDHTQGEINRLFKVIADHMRAIVMAVEDGVKPSNTARGYVIRKLIRRAYHAGTKLKIVEPTFLYQLVDIVAQTLPIYHVNLKKVKQIIRHEEQAFARTIKQGEELLFKTIQDQKVISSQVAFKLLETYGFPLDLTIEIAKAHHIKLDLSTFKELQQQHAKISKQKASFGMDLQLQVIQNVTSKVSEFIGYEHLTSESKVIFQGQENHKNLVLFDKTPFYATSGGQRFDQGLIDGQPVLNVFKDQYHNHWHVINKRLKTQHVKLQVNPQYRTKAMQNHSATHLLGRAIYDVLGFTTQLGSENNGDKLRLDFPAEKRPTEQQIQVIEDRVNHYINAGLKRQYIITTKRQAIAMGAWILEKEAQSSTFEDTVRVVNFGNISIELCGGTHVENSQAIEQFKIVKVESKGSGTYRIEAITSFETIKAYEDHEIKTSLVTFNNIKAKILLINPGYALTPVLTFAGIKSSLEQVKQDYKQALKQSKGQQVHDDLNIAFQSFYNIDTYINLDVESVVLARQRALDLRAKYPDKLFILGAKQHGQQIIVISSLTHDANQILQLLIKKYHGKGGGQKTFAMGQINLSSKLEL